MKRFVFVFLLFLFFIQNISAIVADDYYLHNQPAIEVSNRAEKLLPNTLRVELHEGENETVTVSFLPEKTRDNAVLWKLHRGDGSVEIYPDGKNCIVRGINEGEDTITVSTYGGTKAEIAVRVKKEEEMRLRSFEFEGEVKEEPAFTDKVMQTIIRLLITLSVTLIFVAVFLYLKIKRRKG